MLGIDVGTMYIKSVLFDLEGKEVATAGREVSVEHPKPGWAEQSMKFLWKTTAETVRAVLKKAKVDGDDVVAASPTGQGHGSFLIGKDGKPARNNAIIWLDNRKEDLLKEWYEGWKDRGIASEIYEISGWRLINSMQILHMVWLMKNEPEAVKKTFAHLECKDWIRYKLTGEAYMDATAASMTGLYNTAKLRWEDEFFEKVGIPREKFPEVVSSWRRAGEVTSESAEETGLKRGTPVAAGAVDICSCALGGGVVEPDMCCSVIGTAGIHELCVDRPVYDKEKQYSVVCSAAPDRWYLEGVSMSAGACLRWFRDELGFEEISRGKEEGRSAYQIYDEYVSRVPLGSNGVIFHPFLSGERSPFVKSTARGLLFGLGLWTKKEDILRSIYEGVGFSAKDNLQLFEEAGLPPEVVHLVGGGARSDVWAQIICDITNYAVRIPAGEELGAKGCAIEAGVAAGFYKDPFDAVGRTVRIAKEIKPDKEKHRRYMEIFAVYKELYTELWDVYDQSHALLRSSSP